MAAKLLINEKWRKHTQITGVQRYASQLVDALKRNQLEFASTQPKGSTRLNHAIWEQSILPAQSSTYDTLFCPANMAPLFLPDHVRLVLTLHCLRFYFYPQNYSPPFAAWYRFAIPHLIDRASTILTVSNTTAREIERVYPSAVGKLRVIYPGVSDEFHAQEHPPQADRPPTPYWIFVGNPSPIKNMRVLIEALSYSNAPFKLQLIGVTKAQLNRFFDRHPNLSHHAHRINALGHINDAHRVAQLIRNAIGLAAPSIYESFDLPLAEAMASAIPVLASDTPVHHEIGADAPVFLPQSDPQAWAREMDHLFHDRARANTLAIKSKRRASIFTWDQAAKQTIEVLNSK